MMNAKRDTSIRALGAAFSSAKVAEAALTREGHLSAGEMALAAETIKATLERLAPKLHPHVGSVPPAALHSSLDKARSCAEIAVSRLKAEGHTKEAEDIEEHVVKEIKAIRKLHPTPSPPPRRPRPRR